MTVWTLRQIEQARGLRAKAAVSLQAIDAGPELDVITFTREEIFRVLQKKAHVFAIELDIRDLEWIVEEEPRFSSRVITARWGPTTQKAELRGGPVDGQFLILQHVGRPLRLPRLASSMLDYNPEDHPIAVDQIVLTYELSGWHETQRHWVYEMTGVTR